MIDSTASSARFAPAWRVLRVACLAFALVSVLGGGCYWSASSGDHDHDHHCDHDHNDDDCDDDDDVIVIVASTDGATGGATFAPVDVLPQISDELYVLESTHVEHVERDGHPWRRVVVESGPSVLELWGPGTYGPAHLAGFTARVRSANAELLTLPPEDGAFVFAGTERTKSLVTVNWRQVDPWGRRPPRGDVQQTFVFDTLGRLLLVEDALLVR